MWRATCELRSFGPVTCSVAVTCFHAHPASDRRQPAYGCAWTSIRWRSRNPRRHLYLRNRYTQTTPRLRADGRTAVACPSVGRPGPPKAGQRHKAPFHKIRPMVHLPFGRHDQGLFDVRKRQMVMEPALRRSGPDLPISYALRDMLYVGISAAAANRHCHCASGYEGDRRRPGSGDGRYYASSADLQPEQPGHKHILRTRQQPRRPQRMRRRRPSSYPNEWRHYLCRG